MFTSIKNPKKQTSSISRRRKHRGSRITEVSKNLPQMMYSYYMMMASSHRREATPMQRVRVPDLLKLQRNIWKSVNGSTQQNNIRETNNQKSSVKVARKKKRKLRVQWFRMRVMGGYLKMTLKRREFLTISKPRI